MLARGADVVGNQVIMGDHMPLVGVVPQPADILDQLPVMVDQRVVQGNHPVAE